MNTAQLIEKLRELDPGGEMTVAGADSFASPNLFDDATKATILVAPNVEEEVVYIY